MTVTTKDLKTNISMLCDVLSKGEDVIITYRGKTKVKFVSYNESSNEQEIDSIFGI